MSDIFSIRLSHLNPREAQAIEVIEAWANRGYSLRHTLTEALLLLAKNETGSDRRDEIERKIDRLVTLIERLEGAREARQPLSMAETDLSASFVSSIKTAMKPGVRINHVTREKDG